MSDKELFKLFFRTFFTKEMLFGISYCVGIYGAIYLWAWLT